MKKVFFLFVIYIISISSLCSLDSVEFLMKNMTLQEKVGQLFIIRPESIDLEILEKEKQIKKDIGIETINQKNRNFYYKYPAGGFILFNRNISTPENLSKFTEELHHLGNIKPLLFIDEEGGTVARIGNNKNFSVTQLPEMAFIENDEEAFAAGKIVGKYLKEYGFDVDFAPVADVNTNPLNPVIGNRAFSDNPFTAGQRALSFYKGLNSESIEGCFKHFPGHGDTSTDTHLGYSEIYKNYEEVLNCELLPFKYGISNNISMIMVAHISTPNITGNTLPASLSYEIVTELLRNELNYDGLIITDSLSMKAITNHFSTKEAAIQTILAGNDFILLPADYEEAFEGIIEAINQGIIPETRIDESVSRILNFKKNFLKNTDLPLE